MMDMENIKVNNLYEPIDLSIAVDGNNDFHLIFDAKGLSPVTIKLTKEKTVITIRELLDCLEKIANE